MPNNFGGDQSDPDYDPSVVVRRVPRDALTTPLVDDSSRPSTDKRVRSVVGDYRVVIPDGAQKGRRFFTNNSQVVIEKRGKDATGAEKWDRVTSFPHPSTKNTAESPEALAATYWLLAGPDAE